MPRFGIVICSRLSSNRLPNKAHLYLEDRTVIAHLVNNLRHLNIPIVVTVPNSDFVKYLEDKTLIRGGNVLLHNSEHEDDPLARTYQVAKQFEFDYVIRITHDKIFIDTDSLKEALSISNNIRPDYLFCSHLIPGTNFEVISYKALSEATRKYKNVEHISYAIRDVSTKTIDFNKDNDHFSLKKCSLLLDYEEDYNLFKVIYSRLGNDADFNLVCKYLNKNRELLKINKKPLVTIYTCAYNSSNYLMNAAKSVINQSIFNDAEYLMIDDYSMDETFEIMARLSISHPNIKYIRNHKNLGLATSSNIALSKAKGKYIIRIDSDDFFSSMDSISNLIKYAEITKAEIVYPDNYYGSFDKIQKGNKSHHVGGALFNKNALNFIKFTDGLRGYEGYDLFLRAKDRLKISYFNDPAFFYTQRPGSMSKTNKKERSILKAKIEVINRS